MARVEITRALLDEIHDTFKAESADVLRKIKSLEDNPHKGKKLGTVGGILIKEIRHEKWRFYCITDGHKLLTRSHKELLDLLLRFVRMSDKKTQQATIDEITTVLREIGPGGL